MTSPTGKITDIRLATTEAGLSTGYLIFSLSIPEPDLPLFPDHSARVPLSDGGQSLRGFRSTTLSWNRLNSQQLRVLTKLVDDALDTANGVLFATIDKGWNGSTNTNNFIDVSGKPHLPRPNPTPRTHSLAFDNVVLVINNLTIINDPAVF